MNLGIIGCGQWGANHLRNFSTYDNIEIIKIFDKNLNRLDFLKKLNKNISICTDINEILNDISIKAVIISTPTITHYKIVKQCLLLNKDVLCEKPLTVKASEAMELVELATKRKLILMVGHIFLFNDGIIKLKEFIKNKETNNVYYAQAVRTNLGPIRTDVNSLYDLATHDISIFNYLFDSLPIKVSATGNAYISKKLEDVVFITLTYPNRIIANIHASWLSPKKIRQITIVTEKKMFVWDDMASSSPITIYEKSAKKKEFYSDFGEFNIIIKDGDITIPKINITEPLKQEDSFFLNTIINREINICTGKEGYNVVKILESAQSSIKLMGKSINIKW